MTFAFWDPVVAEQYYKLHAVSPNCGTDDFEQTTMGTRMDNLETARDNNRVYCRCGYKGTVDDLVPAVSK